MKIYQSKEFCSAGGLEISRQAQAQPYAGATDEIISALNSQKGVLLSSGFDFPGRYTRWDIGFVNPPLMISSQARKMTFSALNARGELLLRALATIIKQMSGLVGTQIEDDLIALELEPQEQIIYEENRSRQLSVFSVLRELIAFFYSKEDSYLGLYGAFGYELAFQFEALNLKFERNDDARDMVLYLPDEILVVDHQRESALSYCYDFTFAGASTKALPRSGSTEDFKFSKQVAAPIRGDHYSGEYADTVAKAREYFARGDLFETVPGQLFFERCEDSPADIFKRLKKYNPAPYGALINLGDQEYLVAASPEMYVRVEGDRVETCPIAGTIARGKNAIEDARQIQLLLNSSKEESELSMCTDVDRNDKSRVCVPGSVNVIGRRQLELYSRLIHTVDHVEGKLHPDFDALDAFLTHTWAVTVTGAPKKAAMQFIEDHEKSPRRWYAGAMGHLGFNGDMNTGLTLRTIRIQNGLAEVRAGATLLYDSVPAEEEAETHLKASALLMAIRNSYPEQTDVSAAAQSYAEGHVKIEALMVDHHDSFVHTLSSYFQAAGVRIKTVRAENFAAALLISNPDLVILSPGPGRPDDFNLAQTIKLCLDRSIPIFGVCLGLQGIAEYFGGSVTTLDYPMHGKASLINHAHGPLFTDLQKPFNVGRYHSLVATNIPECLEVTAKTEDGVVMALAHRTLPILAVQFHPESILSEEGNGGQRIIENALTYFSESAFGSVANDSNLSPTPL